MKHNTDTLGYKLLSGKLAERRVHSEQLNKYLAGLFDSDGTVCISFQKGRGKYRAYPLAVITQSASNDTDFQLMRSLKAFYGFGSMTYYVGTDNHKSSYCEWRFHGTSAEKLFGIIGKHLMIKGTHFQNVLNIRERERGCSWDTVPVSIKEESEVSRSNSRYLKRPKHISPAWLAGFLDGDGYYRCRVGRKVFTKGAERIRNHLHVAVSLDTKDSFILDMIATTFGGKVDRSGLYPRWTKGLGRGNKKSSIDFLSKMRKFSCLEKKYLIVDDMIKFHQEPAETKQVLCES